MGQRLGFRRRPTQEYGAAAGSVDRRFFRKPYQSVQRHKARYNAHQSLPVLAGSGVRPVDMISAGRTGVSSISKERFR